MTRMPPIRIAGATAAVTEGSTRLRFVVAADVGSAPDPTPTSARVRPAVANEGAVPAPPWCAPHDAGSDAGRMPPSGGRD